MVGLELRISHAGPSNEVVIVTARGYIDTTTSPDFSLFIEHQLGIGKFRFVMDLGEVDYISSTGWGVFIGNLREIRDHGGDIVLANMVTGVHNIFNLMDLSSIIKDYDSVESALSHFLLDREETGSWRAVERTPPVNKKKPGTRQAHYEKEDRRKDDTKASRGRDGISVHSEKYPSPVSPGKGAPSERISHSRRPSGSAPLRRAQGPEESFFAIARTELGRRILRVIFDYPFYEVKEIGKALKLSEYGWKRASHRAIMNELRQMGLVDKKRRYDYVLHIRASRSERK